MNYSHLYKWEWFTYKDGVPLYESNGGEWKFFDREGKQIISNFDNITDVKKLN